MGTSERSLYENMFAICSREAVLTNVLLTSIENPMGAPHRTCIWACYFSHGPCPRPLILLLLGVPGLGRMATVLGREAMADDFQCPVPGCPACSVAGWIPLRDLHACLVLWGPWQRPSLQLLQISVACGLPPIFVKATSKGPPFVAGSGQGGSRRTRIIC